MLRMVSRGPSPGPTACYQWSCVGPALAPKRATYGIVWAHHWPQSMLWTVLHGPIAGPQSVLRMILHRSSTGHPAYYRWSCVGPALAPMHANDGLAWAPPWPPSMLL